MQESGKTIIQGSLLKYLSFLAVSFYQGAAAAGKISPEAGSVLRTITGIVNFQAGRVAKAFQSGEIDMEPLEFFFTWMTDEDYCELDADFEISGPMWDNLLAAFQKLPAFRHALKNSGRDIGGFNHLIWSLEKVFHFTLFDLSRAAANNLADTLFRERNVEGGRLLMKEAADGEEPLFYCPRCGLPYPDKPGDEKCEGCQYPASGFRLYPRR